MRPVGYAGHLRGIHAHGGGAGHPLLPDPDAEEEPGRDAEGKDKEEHFNLRARVHDQVGAHDGRDGSAGADRRHFAAAAEEDMQRVRGQSARQVEEQEAEVADGRLDVVAEDPQEEHIADQVAGAAVQKHAGQQGDQVLPPADLGGNGAPGVDEVAQRLGLHGGLVEKDDDIEGQQPVTDNRVMAAFDVFVAYGKNHGHCFFSEPPGTSEDGLLGEQGFS